MELKILKMERLEQEMPHIIIAQVKALSFIFQHLTSVYWSLLPTRRCMFLDSLTVLVSEQTAQSRAEKERFTIKLQLIHLSAIPQKPINSSLFLWWRILLHIIEWMKDLILPISTLSPRPLAHSVLARSPSLYSLSRPSSAHFQHIFFCMECSPPTTPPQELSQQTWNHLAYSWAHLLTSSLPLIR